ncbi:hypothetical protein DPMN_102657 [Dreissena polymorpha]|uniref:Uncharacterized protein n=1 Tax=Dreissena polymorpha TaxID=45954 RepID=A0A9D4LKX1_DREPO|nr:hypothetical protein DPMN_102657 [Dreissena polymorpha]
MRNNIVIYELTEILKGNCTQLVLNLFSEELDIDTSDMHIERAHRMGRFDRKCRDAKRHMVVRFRDNVDTETIMENAYKLKRSPFGLDRQYPKEISKARSSLFKSQEARNAAMKRHKVQIKYPARLCINGRTMIDMFPEWFQVLGHDRLVA